METESEEAANHLPVDEPVNDGEPKALVEASGKPERRYFKSGYFAKKLTDEERELCLDVLDAIFEQYPEVKENLVWRMQAQTLAREIVLADRLPPPRTPADDHGFKVSVSREKVKLALMQQLGLTRAQAKEREVKESPAKWSQDRGFAISKPDRTRSH